MLRLGQVIAELERLAPLELAEPWDNVGLLIGDPVRPVARVMTCLSLTPVTAAEAVSQRVNLVVVHHPLPFRPLARLTTGDTPGRVLLELTAAQVAVYSAHTAFDSAAEGVNQQLAAALDLQDLAPLVAHPSGLGAGRWGRLASPTSATALAARLARFLQIDTLQLVGQAATDLTRVAVACGSAGDLVPAAWSHDCQLLVTGELRFHDCLEIEAQGRSALLVGHYSSERFAQQQLAIRLAQALPELSVWASRDERDPLCWLRPGAMN